MGLGFHWSIRASAWQKTSATATHCSSVEFDITAVPVSQTHPAAPKRGVTNVAHMAPVRSGPG